MVSSLIRRVVALETRALPASEIDAIVITLVEPSENGPLYREPIAVRTPDASWRLERSPGEAVGAFHDRAGRLCPRTGDNIPTLIEVYE